MYGGWSLEYGRSFEAVYVLSIPSFTWINVTQVSDQSNREEQVNSTIGRDSMSNSCQVYNGALLIELGGDVRSDGYSLTNGACSEAFAPMQVLDLSTYEWQTSFDPSVTYQVPPAIYDVIGGKSVTNNHVNSHSRADQIPAQAAAPHRLSHKAALRTPHSRPFCSNVCLERVTLLHHYPRPELPRLHRARQSPSRTNRPIPMLELLPVEWSVALLDSPPLPASSGSSGIADAMTSRHRRLDIHVVLRHLRRRWKQLISTSFMAMIDCRRQIPGRFTRCRTRSKLLS